MSTSGTPPIDTSADILIERLSQLNLSAQSATTSKPILVSDLLPMVAKHLPGYHFVGNQSLAIISRRMQQELKKPQWDEKKSHQYLIDSCTTGEDALYILTDDSVSKNLKFTDVFKIAAVHPELSQAILKDETLLTALKGLENTYNLTSFSPKHRSVPKELARDANQPENAEQMLKNPETRVNLKGSDLVTLGQHHASTAQSILDDEVLRNKLTPYELADMAKHHPHLIDRILDNEELCIMLPGIALARLVQLHLPSCQRMLIVKTLREKLTSCALAELGRYHLSIAQAILADKALEKRLQDGMGQFAQFHVSISHQFLTDLLQANLEQFESLSATLSILGRNSISNAKIILSNKLLFNRLKPEDRFKISKKMEIFEKVKELAMNIKHSRKIGSPTMK